MPDYQLSVQILGANELAAALKSPNSIIVSELKKALDKTAMQLEKYARPKAPHKTGTLQRSIHREPAGLTANNVEAKVGTKLDYARAQEYGTVGMTIHSHSRTGTPFTYIGNIQPKFYMRDARSDVRPDMTKYMTEAVKNIIDHFVKVTLHI